MQLQDISELKKYWTFTETPTLLRNVANMIYFGRLGDQEVVLRLTPSSQREAIEVQAELEWMTDLESKGFLVPHLIRSSSGKLFETLKINDQIFHAMVMIKIEGIKIEDSLLDEKIVLQWSDLLAKLHQHSPPEGSHYLRADWDHDYIMKSSLPEVPNCEEPIQKLFHELVSFVRHRPKDQYGLIHGDVHTGNFFYRNGEIVIFDFDDSCYHHFLYDLTVPIMAIFKIVEKPEQIERRNHLINLFITNYFKDKPRPENFKTDFVKFIQFRNLLVYFWLRVIRREREFSEAMTKNIDFAIQDDLRIATHPELFDFIED